MFTFFYLIQFCAYTGKNNKFPILDILGYLKNTHKNPKLGRVRQVPIWEIGWEFPDWDLSHSPKFDCVYRHTYEVFVLGTIRLLVSNRVVNLFPLRSFNFNFNFLRVYTLRICRVRNIIIPICMLHSLLATVIKGYGNFRQFEIKWLPCFARRCEFNSKY